MASYYSNFQLYKACKEEAFILAKECDNLKYHNYKVKLISNKYLLLQLKREIVKD